MPEIVGLILALVAGGYGLRKLGLVHEDASRDANQLVLYLFLPALVFRSLHHAELNWPLLAMPLLGWTGVAAGLAAGVIVIRLRKFPPELSGAFLLAGSLGNTTYLGYPIVRALFGESHLALAIFYDLLGPKLASNTLGVIVAGSSAGKAVSTAGTVRQVASLPVLWALVLGLACRGVPIPAPIDRLLDQIGQLTVPVSMVTMGLALRLRHWRYHWRLALVAVGIKLVLVPLAVWGAALALGVPPDFLQTAVIESAMPTMFYSLNLVLFFGLDTPFILNAIALSSVLCAASLPLWAWLLGQ